MCVRPGSESPAEGLDEALWKLFRAWISYTSMRPDDDGNGVEDFCSCVRTRLEKLVRERSDRTNAGA
ncbi:MAG: hypothetical protein JXQ73_28615 [Phycisphaerae bacterium]|nr:hypothetical protein [Phycisphaerae bacterium]